MQQDALHDVFVRVGAFDHVVVQRAQALLHADLELIAGVVHDELRQQRVELG